MPAPPPVRSARSAFSIARPQRRLALLHGLPLLADGQCSSPPAVSTLIRGIPMSTIPHSAARLRGELPAVHEAPAGGAAGTAISGARRPREEARGAHNAVKATGTAAGDSWMRKLAQAQWIAIASVVVPRPSAVDRLPRHLSITAEDALEPMRAMRVAIITQRLPSCRYGAAVHCRPAQLSLRTHLVPTGWNRTSDDPTACAARASRP